MPKIKMPKSSPSIDMTPMVDLGFLLVTFFMLTTQFLPEEPVSPKTPSSISELKIEEKNLILISIDDKDRVFFTLDNQKQRKNVLKKMSEQYGVTFTEEEQTIFSNASSFGVPIKDLKTWLNLESSQRAQYPTNGIPCDSVRNELNDWVLYSRLEKEEYKMETQQDYHVAIKGDRNASYKKIKEVIASLEKAEIYKFNLVTDLKIK